MSETRPEPSDELSQAVRKDLASIMDLNLQIGSITAQRDEVLKFIRERIRLEGLPEAEKFTAYVLMSADMQKSPEEIAQEISSLKQIDKQVREARGQVISWLSVDEETVSHRDPGPNLTANRYDFNLGLLPHDASLEVGPIGCRIPIANGLRIEIFNNLDKKLSWDMDLGGFYNFCSQPEALDRNEIYVTGSGPISFSKGKVYITPPPAIGNKAVGEIFGRHNLEEQPLVVEALQSLTRSLSHS